MRFFIAFFLLVFIACGGSKSENVESAPIKDKIRRIRPEKKVLQFGDSLFLSNNVSCINSHDGLISILDGDKGRIILSDLGLNAFKLFGNKGRGPKEFLRLHSSIFVDTVIYIKDDLGFQLHRYNFNGDYIDQKPFDGEEPYGLKFTIHNNRYFSSKNKVDYAKKEMTSYFYKSDLSNWNNVDRLRSELLDSIKNGPFHMFSNGEDVYGISSTASELIKLVNGKFKLLTIPKTKIIEDKMISNRKADIEMNNRTPKFRFFSYSFLFRDLCKTH